MTVNRIASAYGRPQSQYQAWAREGLLRYVADTKNPDLVRLVGLQLPVSGSPNQGSSPDTVLSRWDVVNFSRSGKADAALDAARNASTTTRDLADSALSNVDLTRQLNGNQQNGIPRGLPSEQTADSRALESKINGWRERSGLAGRVRLREVRAVSLPVELNRALVGFTHATGTRVVLFRNLTPEVDDFNGVNFRDGVLYINESSQNPITLTAAHEWVHNLKRSDPALYQRIENEVRRQGRLDDWHKRNIREEGMDRGRDHAIEELTAAAVSDAMTDPAFLQKLPDRNGVTPINAFRRSEMMASSALRDGGTAHLQPHESQRLPFWRGGDFGKPPTQAEQWFNIGYLFLKSAAVTLNHVPLLDRVRFNFETRRFEDAKGREFTDADFRALLSQLPAGKAGVGRSTAKRAVLTASYAQRMDGQGLDQARLAGHRLLDDRPGLGSDLRGEDAAGLVAPDALQDVLYSVSDVETNQAGRGSRSGLSMDEGQRLKRELTAHWGNDAPRVVLVQSADEMQAIARQQGVDPSTVDDTVEGMYLGQPTVWINLSAIHTEERFAKVLAHEALGHYGVEHVVGKREWASIITAINRHVQNSTGAEDVQAAIAQLRQTQPDIFTIKDATKRQETIAKEVIAVMAENGSRNGLVQRVLVAVRKFLRKLMPNREWSDAEIRDLIHQSDRFLRDGRSNAQARAGARASVGAVLTDADVIKPFTNRTGLYSFAGKNAATADKLALSAAQQRIKAGEDAEAVRKETGWHKGADGKWRFEISDADAKLGELRDDGGRKAHANDDLGALLDHPALFAAYPALRNVWTQIEVDPSFESSGSYTAARPENASTASRGAQIHVKAPNEREALSVLLHEIQHGIQDVEGFATGGAPERLDDLDVTEREVGKVSRQISELLDSNAEFGKLVRQRNRMFIEIMDRYGQAKPRESTGKAEKTLDWSAVPDVESEPYFSLIDDIVQRFPQEDERLSELEAKRHTASRGVTTSAVDQYRSLAGEVEARNTQSRQKLTGAERRTTAPSSTADVADADVVVTFNGKEMHNAPMPANASTGAVPDAEVEALVREFANMDGAPTEAEIREAIKQYRDTERAYGGRDAYDKAKSEGKTKLTYGQWVQVRTPNFLRWFGDWLALRSQTRLDAMKPVKVRVPDDWRGLSHVELRQKMAEALDRLVRDRVEIEHPELGAIRVGRTGASKTVNTARDPAKSLVVADIEALIPASIYARSEPSRGGDGKDIDGYSTLLARVDVDGVPLVAAFTIRHQSDGRWYYNAVTLHDGHEKARDSYGRPDQNGSSDAPIAGLADFVRRPLTRVNPATVSKVVDPETGEPMVVYHGTNADFDTFDKEKTGSATDDGAFGAGFYFSPKNGNGGRQMGTAGAYASEAGGNIMPAFLNIRDPLIAASAEYGNVRVDQQDGVIVETAIRGSRGELQEFVAFSPNQIKSATANIGTFSERYNIMFSRAPAADASMRTPEEALDSIELDKRPLSLSIKGGLTWLKKNLGLGLLPANYLADFAPESIRPRVKEFMKIKRSMDAYRGEKHAANDDVSQEWLRLVCTDRAGASAFSQVAHESTLAWVDPTEEKLKSLQFIFGSDAEGNPRHWDATPDNAKAVKKALKREWLQRGGDNKQPYYDRINEIDAKVEAEKRRPSAHARLRAAARWGWVMDKNQSRWGTSSWHTSHAVERL